MQINTCHLTNHIVWIKFMKNLIKSFWCQKPPPIFRNDTVSLPVLILQVYNHLYAIINGAQNQIHIFQIIFSSRINNLKGLSVSFYFLMRRRFSIEALEHSHQVSHKKCHFDTSKTYFIILAHYFTTYHLSDVLYFNSIY